MSDKQRVRLPNPPIVAAPPVAKTEPDSPLPQKWPWAIAILMLATLIGIVGAGYHDRLAGSLRRSDLAVQKSGNVMISKENVATDAKKEESSPWYGAEPPAWYRAQAKWNEAVEQNLEDGRKTVQELRESVRAQAQLIALLEAPYGLPFWAWPALMIVTFVCALIAIALALQRKRS